MAGDEQDLWAGRELAWRLAVRDISAQYRQSVLGVLWALINPLTTTAVWLFLSTSRLVQVAATPGSPIRCLCSPARCCGRS